MIRIELINNNGYRWFSKENISVKGVAIFNDKINLRNNDLWLHFRNVHSEEEFITALNSLNGLFSVIIKKNNTIWAAVDIVRTFPLLYSIENENIKISDNHSSFSPMTIDKEAEIAMRHITWVPGNKTLIKNVFQLQGGEYLTFSDGKLKTAFWNRINPSVKTVLNRREWKDLIKSVFLEIGQRLSLTIGQHPVALPLSGGYDSRLIGLLLKLSGHENVICFTFGYENCKEAQNSKEIAKRLGYPWLFIDYAPYIYEDFTFSPQYLEYADFIGNANTFPYFQDYFAARYLKEIVKLPENTIFLPGHSGDSIGGCSFTPDLKSFKSKEDLSAKIFRMYGHGIFPSGKNKRLIREMIEQNIDEDRIQSGSLSYEDWQIQESHTKQLVNSSKVFDFFGYEYLLPLSDKYYYNVFASVPNEYRIHKNLHEEVLVELFKEHGILLNDEITPPQKKLKTAHILLKIREAFPFLARFRKRTFSSDFFPYEQMMKHLQEKVPPGSYKSGNAINAAWYIKHLFEPK